MTPAANDFADRVLANRFLADRFFANRPIAQAKVVKFVNLAAHFKTKGLQLVPPSRHNNFVEKAYKPRKLPPRVNDACQ